MKNLGLSGDKVQIDGDCVIKICRTDQNRFLKNIFKQKMFNNPYLESVPILSQSITEDGDNFIKMPLLRCDNAIEWISKCNMSEVDSFVNVLNNYFYYILINSKLSEFDYKIWIDKIDDLKSKIKDDYLKNVLSSLRDCKFKNLFYYGDYHGDFTLTNLFIFTDVDCLVVETIDFLHSFIQSPINDIVKMRQDTKHLWTLKLINSKIGLDVNKTVIILNYIDEKIKKIIQQNDVLSEFYLPFQIVNLMRIIPYNKDIEIFDYLKKEITVLFNEFKE